MRTIILPLVAVLLGACSLAHGQDARGKKAKSRTGAIWAVAHEEAPLPVQNLPQAPPVTLAAPVVQHAPPPMHVVAHPVAQTESCHDACPADCNQPGFKCKLRYKCACLLDFLCYRRNRDCCKGCGYYPYTPLYLYFLGQCKEGACHTTQCAGPTCGAGGCWNKSVTGGHAMFAMPSGPGVGGVR